jgi:hypothetical protein
MGWESVRFSLAWLSRSYIVVATTLEHRNSFPAEKKIGEGSASETRSGRLFDKKGVVDISLEKSHIYSTEKKNRACEPVGCQDSFDV